MNEYLWFFSIWLNLHKFLLINIYCVKIWKRFLANTCTNLRHAGFAVHHKVPVFSVHAVGQAVLPYKGPVFRARSSVSASRSLSDEATHRLGCSQVHLEPLLSSQWLRWGGEPAGPASHQTRRTRGPTEISKRGRRDLWVRKLSREKTLELGAWSVWE